MSSSNQNTIFDDTDNFNRQYDKSYALSGKIMLSAIVVLFFVVILMVCLHLYARWYIIRSRRRNPRRTVRRGHLVFHVDANAQQSSRGLDAAVLRSLPVFVFAGGDSPIECAVCLSEFEEKESGRRLPKCGHSFHTECIDMWFHSHNTCPLCRSPVEPPPSPPSSAADPDVRIELSAADIPTASGSDSSFCADCAAEEASSSLEARRKKPVSVSIDVPARNGEAGFDSPASQSTPSFRSPMSRMLSFTRILSRERRNGGVSPSGSGNSVPGGCSSGSANELDIERGKEATQ